MGIIFIKTVPDLFLRNYKKVFYFLNEKYDRSCKKKHWITSYEGKLKIACHTYRNAFNIYRNLFRICIFVLHRKITVLYHYTQEKRLFLYFIYNFGVRVLDPLSSKIILFNQVSGFVGIFKIKIWCTKS